jgi:hypothetical protein
MTTWSKSSRSAGNGACVEWRKSTYSADTAACVEWHRSAGHCNDGGCVEVTRHDVVQVRDSKDPDGPVLTFTPGAWVQFIAGVKAGHFDL